VEKLSFEPQSIICQKPTLAGSRSLTIYKAKIINFNCTFYLIERLRSKAWRGTVEETGSPEGREERKTSEHSRSRQIDLSPVFAPTGGRSGSWSGPCFTTSWWPDRTRLVGLSLNPYRTRGRGTRPEQGR